jgi:hypothetical protein
MIRLRVVGLGRWPSDLVQSVKLSLTLNPQLHIVGCRSDDYLFCKGNPMNIRRHIFDATIAIGALALVVSTAQAVVMQTVYKGNVSINSFDEPGFFGQGVRIDGLPFELSLIWDRDDLISSDQTGVTDGSGPGLVSFLTKPIRISLKVGTSTRNFDQFTTDDNYSEIRANDRFSSGGFSTQTEFSSGNFGLGTEFSCALGVKLPGNFQPLLLTERYQISNATPADARGQCGTLQAMNGLLFGLDATSLSVAPLVTPIPVPPAIPLLLTGIATLFGVRRRKK